MTEGQMAVLQAEIDTLTQERDEARAQRDQAQAELLATMRQRDEAVGMLEAMLGESYKSPECKQQKDCTGCPHRATCVWEQARAIVAKYAGAEAEEPTP